jgi:hypothetical protein
MEISSRTRDAHRMFQSVNLRQVLIKFPGGFGAVVQLRSCQIVYMVGDVRVASKAIGGSAAMWRVIPLDFIPPSSYKAGRNRCNSAMTAKPAELAFLLDSHHTAIRCHQRQINSRADVIALVACKVSLHQPMHSDGMSRLADREYLCASL